jgi:TorA maturation chaperone TorD
LCESFELSIIQEENLDDHIMLKNLSPKQSESFKESEEECLENTIAKYHSSRDSFHVLISDSFYSLYLDLFLDSGGLDTLPTTSYYFPPQSDHFDMPRFGEINSKHNIYEVRFDALSLSSLTWEKDMLQDDFTHLFLKKTMHSLLWRSNILHCIFVL